MATVYQKISFLTLSGTFSLFVEKLGKNLKKWAGKSQVLIFQINWFRFYQNRSKIAAYIMFTNSIIYLLEITRYLKVKVKVKVTGWPNMIFWALWLFFSKRGYKKLKKEKKNQRQISNALLRVPWVWGIKRQKNYKIFNFSEYIQFLHYGY